MARVGILTYFWAHNPGTFLQAYATQQAFKARLSHDTVEMVDYRFLRNVFRVEARHIHLLQLFKDLRRYWIYRREQAKHFVLSSDRLVSEDYDRTVDFLKSLKYDMLISGADTILEFRPFNYRDDTVPIYWLPPELACRRVMCGSSAKGLTTNNVNAHQKRLLRRCVSGLSLIGVRDAATRELFRELGCVDQSKLLEVPDPTFSLNIDHERVAAFVQARRLDFSRPTVLLGLPFGYPFGAQIERYYRERGYRIFALNYSPHADVYLPDLSPFEWAGIYRYFHVVVTDRFHGTLFSIRNGTPVVSIVCRKDLVTPTGESKYSSLWRLFGMEDTNCINSMECGDAKTLLEKIDRGVKAFRAMSLENKLETTLSQLKQQYLTFVDKVAALMEK